MMQNETLRVLDTEQEHTERTNDAETDTDQVVSVPVAAYYDDASEVTFSDYERSYSFPTFITAVLNRIGKEFDARDAKLVDDIQESDDVDFGLLVAFPDESLMFIGSDPTAKDSIPWFAFVLEPTAPRPAPESAQDALDLLKPARVREYIEDESWLPDRHGEWWLLPCHLVPGGTVFKPGVQSRPFGPSPLGNHVPREYAFTVSDSEFMDRFQAGFPQAPGSIESPPEVMEWTWRQVKKAKPPEWTPGWTDIRGFAGDVLVRGTVRHRDNDHYVEQLGEQWHLADTHDVKVYTGDEIATRIHLDYRGG